jgi:hypothetical protein
MSYLPPASQFRRQSALTEYGPPGSGFDPRTYGAAYGGAAGPAGAAAVSTRTSLAPGTQQRRQTPSGNTAGGDGAARSRSAAPRAHRAVLISQLAVHSQHVGGEGSTVLLDNVELGMVSVVGRVVDVVPPPPTAVKAPALTVVVTDGTGLLIARSWEPALDDAAVFAQPAASIDIGALVLVTGQPRPPPSTGTAPDEPAVSTRPAAAAAAGDWSITGRVVLLWDWNRLQYHLLDAIHTSLRLTRGDYPPTATSSHRRATTAGLGTSAFPAQAPLTLKAQPNHLPVGLNSVVVMPPEPGLRDRASHHQQQPLAPSSRAALVPLGVNATASLVVPPRCAAAAGSRVSAVLADPPAAVTVVQLTSMRPDEAVGQALTAPGVDPDVGLTASEIIDATVAAVQKKMRCKRADAEGAIRREVARLADEGVLCTTIDELHYCLATA